VQGRGGKRNLSVDLAARLDDDDGELTLLGDAKSSRWVTLISPEWRP
jgi:hypothetical protein